MFKPCPFCGSANLESGGDDKIVAVRCRDCEATGPNHYGSRAEWNTRSLHLPEPQTAPTCICPRCSATIVGEMNGPEDELQTAPADWVVRKGGYFYRHGSRGYTSSLIEAGRYAESEARAQTENCEGVTAHLASEFLPPADAVRLALADEMERWREDMVPRPADEYHEDMGSALWWKFPIEEPPYVGGPNDLGQAVEVTVQAFGVDKMMRVNVGGWPGYHTHFTPIPLPSAPKNTGG